MLDGIIGDWYTELADLELNPEYKLFNFKHNVLPRINKENFRKELQRLIKIGLSTLVQQSQYSTPVFIIPKKEGTVRFITDHLRLKQKLVRKMYPLTIIGEPMQNLEGLQYATSLDINMGSYNIMIFPASQDMTRIVSKLGNFKYNQLPMGICALGYILRAKVDVLVGNTDGVKTYIDDI